MLNIQGLMFGSFIIGLALWPFSGKLELARNSSTDYVVVQSEKATEPEKFAVTELTNFLSRVTGAAFPVVAESSLPKGARGIYVGWTTFAEQNGIQAPKLGEEEWIIRSIGRNLVLTGGRPRGTMYAVYEFLEQQVGCHWLDYNTEIIPARPTLKLGKLEIQGKPLMWRRNIDTADIWRSDADRCKFWLRNKHYVTPGQDFQYAFNYSFPTGAFYQVQGSPGFCHTITRYVNASNWFETHPEYFSLNGKGKRVPAYNDIGPGQLCQTHPDVRRLALESLRKFIANDRAKAAREGFRPPLIYDISQIDKYDELCKCTNCQAIVAREGGESGPMIDFINAIAEGIEKDYPDIFIQPFAYHATKKPPATLKPRHNVIVRWCDTESDLVRPLSHPYNAKTRETLLGWGKIAPHLAVWDYWIHGSYFPTPYSLIQCIGPDLKLFADMHMESFFAESQERLNPGENFTALKYWLGCKLLVNPYQPVEPLIKIFMDGYYGAASSKMNDYLKYLEGRVDKEAGYMMTRYAPYDLKYLDVNFFVTAEKLFDEAEASVKPGSLELRHVQRERFVVDGALLYLWPWLDRKLAPDVTMPFDHETVIRRYETNWKTNLRREFKYYFSHLYSQSGPREDKIPALAALFRDPKLPEPFNKLPPREVADFNWLTFNEWYPSYRTFVEDKDAAGERALVFLGGKDEEHKNPVSFGMTGGATVTLKPEEIPQDGKYHLFKIGMINVKKGISARAKGTVWALEGMKLGVDVTRVCVSNAPDPSVNDWNAYISLKFKGPAYVKGSTNANEVWMDRVLLVKPQPGEKPGAAELLRREEEKKQDARRPKVQAPRSPQGAAGDPLKVDWDKAVSAGAWSTLTGQATPRKVEARFAQDGEYLYIRLTEEMDTKKLMNDPKIFEGDDWELFFAAKRGEQPYRQIGINPKGDYQALAYGEGSDKWATGVNVISEAGANSWKVSLGFPLDRLLPGGVKPGQTIYANIFRGGDHPLAWSPTFDGGFHLLERLGEIVVE